VFDLSWTTATFWVAAVACVVAQVAIVRSVLVAGAPASRAPEGGALPGPAAVRRSAEVAWAVVPAVALGVVLALTWRAV
jgi:heme/copper-type cytochrome/quinol oxidase subunit 2